jgi:hypothetical protein
MTTPALAVAVITLPVSHVDRALQFYVDQVGLSPGLDAGRGDYRGPPDDAHERPSRGRSCERVRPRARRRAGSCPTAAG